MKNHKNIVVAFEALLAFVLLSTEIQGQNFQGMATYRSDRDMSQFQFQAEGMSPDQMNDMKAQLKRQFQKDYELRFNLTESTWKEAESLDAGPATAGAGGMVISISMGSGVTYKNTAEKSVLQQTEAFSKLFLISDDLEKRDWKLTGKSKKIGDYTALEARYESVDEVQTISMSDEEKSSDTRMDTTRVTVWYTPDIPVPHGPEEYWGLPRLILELNDGNVTYLCTKIELNPDKGIEIEKPKKGKKVSAEEFEALQAETMQKMMKKYQGSGDGEEQVMMIRSGD